MRPARFSDLLRLEPVFTADLARPGTVYRVRERLRTVPELEFKGDPKTWILTESMLSQMADLMEYADGLLRSNQIEYVVCYGTLLGVHRHAGFIPWDDDVDLFILNADDMPRVGDLEEQIAADGYRLIRVNDYYKLAHASSPLGFPFLDFYQLWDQMDRDQIYPIGRMGFEDFEVNVPCKGEELIHRAYGADPSALATVVHDRVFAHRLAMLIFMLLGERVYNLATHWSGWMRDLLGLEKYSA